MYQDNGMFGLNELYNVLKTFNVVGNNNDAVAVPSIQDVSVTDPSNSLYTMGEDVKGG